MLTRQLANRHHPMRYKKLSFLLVVSLVFFLSVSLVLICAWFYYYFHDNKKAEIRIPLNDTISHQKKFDSLQNLYTASIGTLDTLSAYGNDSVRADINNKLAEFYRLRNEVNSLLQERSNPDKLETARLKITSLQQKIDELKARTMKVEYENKRLSSMLQQLSNELKTGEDATRRTPSGTFSKLPQDKPAVPPLLNISDVKISALSGSTEKVEETGSAEETERLSGTFTVRSNVHLSTNTELMIVVIQPDGRILQSTSWESGSFETREGKKIYSSKVLFDYKGEQKQLSFSISADEFQKGEYKVFIYQNGVVIGKGSKTLN
jgi:hypothetical protein